MKFSMTGQGKCDL